MPYDDKIEQHNKTQSPHKAANFNTESKDDTPDLSMTVWKYLDKKKKKDIGYERFFEIAKENQTLNQDISQSNDTAKIKIETDRRYIPIIFSSDWHLGSGSVDYDHLRRHIDFVMNNEVFMMLFGDLNDNFKHFKNIMPILEQVLNPKMQFECLASIIKAFMEAKPKRILAAWWGNHDVEWDEKTFGESPVKRMLSEHFCYFNGKGAVQLIINEQKYFICGSHFFKGFSIYNKTHALIRAARYDFGGLADVIIQAHKHEYAYSFVRDYEIFREFGYDEFGGDIHMLQIGTFKIDDGHSKRFWKKGQVGVPILLFDTEKKDIIWLKGPEYIAPYLK